jgi:hypothetical protein
VSTELCYQPWIKYTCADAVNRPINLSATVPIIINNPKTLGSPPKRDRLPGFLENHYQLQKPTGFTLSALLVWNTELLLGIGNTQPTAFGISAFQPRAVNRPKNPSASVPITKGKNILKFFFL